MLEWSKTALWKKQCIHAAQFKNDSTDDLIFFLMFLTIFQPKEMYVLFIVVFHFDPRHLIVAINVTFATFSSVFLQNKETHHK